MKRIAAFISVAISVLCVMLCVACRVEREHEHSFVSYVYNDDATCLDDGTETAKCEHCVVTDTRIKPGTATGEHDYIDYVCSACKTIEPSAPYTPGLRYIPIADGDDIIGYSVNGYYIQNAAYIKIPAVHEDKPILTILEDAFYNLSDIISAEIPDGVTYIGRRAFAACINLAKVTIPQSVTDIGYYSFGFCGMLTRITIPSGVTEIKYGTFMGCAGLSRIDLSNGLTTIGERAFEECVGLTEIDLPESVTTVENSAFCRCSGLTRISMPSVTSIGRSVFSECEKLSRVSVGSSLTTIEDGAFDYCHNLSRIYYNGTKAQWQAINKSDVIFYAYDYTIFCTDGKLTKSDI